VFAAFEALVLGIAFLGQTPGSQSSTVANALTKLPQLTHYVEAHYPEDAFKEGREGVVTLAIDVDIAGDVQRVEVLESTSPEFDVPAMEAAAGFEFTPAEAGKLGPVPVRIVYRYGFKIIVAPKPSIAETPNAPPPPINFAGTIKEAGSRKPIGYATVDVSISSTSTNTKSSTEADENGRFAFRGLPAGKLVVTVRAPLFLRFDAREELHEREALEVLYYITRSERNPYEVVVRGKIERKEVSRTTLQMEDVARIPGTQGDPIRVIQNLPGLARTPFGLGLLVVRGAPPQDTGVYLDGHLLPILFHFGGIAGLTAVVNARMLDSIDFYPGGFGPETGRVSAGAVMLRSKYAETDRVHGEADVSIAGASVFVEGPVTKDENDGAFVVALRRSYVDGVLAGVLSAVDSSVAIAPRYYDYQARYDKPLGSRTRMLTMLAYGSDDELVLVGSASGNNAISSGIESRTYFHRLNPRFVYQPNKETMLSISPIVGVDSSNLSTTADASGNQTHVTLQDWNAGLRVDGLLQLLPDLQLRAGGDVLYYRFSTDSQVQALPRAKAFPSPVAGDVPPRKDQATVPALLSSLYVELPWSATERLRIFPGLRLDMYNFYADPAPLIDPRLVEGRTKLGADPRITARYQLTETLWLKAQAGIYQQPPLPSNLYLNADLPLQRVQQYSGGFDMDVIQNLRLDVTGYFRYGDRVPRFDTSDTEVVDGMVRAVGSKSDMFLRAYGVEVLLKLEKRWGLTGWIAYTLSRAETRRYGQEWRQNLFTDQTHNLIIVATYDLALNWFLGFRFRYVTGGGLPGTMARWYDSDRDNYGRESTHDLIRAPAFNQLDLRVDKRWVFDEWYLEAYLELDNVFNVRNTELYIPTFDFKNQVAIPSLPIFPVIGVKGIF
jgi:TonB family protein